MSDQPLAPQPAEPLAHWPPDDAVQEEVAATLERVLQRVEKAAAQKEHKAVRKAVTAVLEGVLQRVERSCTQLVTEVDGLALHLSERNAYGYLGVTKNGKRYVAGSTSGRHGVKLGSFATPVEAAVAFARHEEVRSVLDGLIDQVAGVGPPPRGPRSTPAVLERVMEAEGLTLHLSERAASGYKGVTCTGRRFSVTGSTRGKHLGTNLGTFDTAVEAAVAFAAAAAAARRRPPPA